MRVVIALILVLSLGCGRTRNHNQGNDDGKTNQGRLCNNDQALIGKWQGLTRQELLIFKNDCTVKSLFTNLSGFFEQRGKDYLGNYHLNITNYSTSGEYPIGSKVYLYRYNLSGNLEIIVDEQIQEYYKL